MATEDWKNHAYPLKAIQIQLQGTRHSDITDMLASLKRVKECVERGDKTGQNDDDDFGFKFTLLETSEISIFDDAFVIHQSKDKTDSTNAVKDVLAERHRQKEVHGRSIKHDDSHTDGVMALAAAGYAEAAAWGIMAPNQPQSTPDDPPELWPDEWDFKPGTSRRMLVKAAALILAEIERIDRATVI